MTQCASLLHRGMARLGWPGWLVKY